jgi:Tol biopolymer transport system component
LPLPSGARLGPYEIVSALGIGGMGEVYRARDTKLNREVAIKVLLPAVVTDPDRLARFSREAQLLASLNHPNIAHIHGLEESGGTRALVMELVDGPTLADRIALGPIPVEQALPIAKQLAEALEAAHEQGIVHRDLKPANIKVREDGTVKVLDFGLAKALDAGLASSSNATMSPTVSMHATQAGVLLGTAAYMSPEQARGVAVDRRADLWAFGVVLYEMLTGTPLFEGATISDTLAAVLTKEPNWTALPAQTPSSVRRLLRRCVEKDRKRRLADAGDARLEIDDAPLIEDGQRTGVVAQTSRSTWRRAAPIVAAALVGLGVGMGTTWRAMRAASVTPGVVRLTIAPMAGESFGTPSPDPDLAVSLDGRRIVYVGQMGGQTRLSVRAIDRLEARVLDGLPTGFGAVRSPFLSPDGAWVGFFESTGNTHSLNKVPLAGGAAVALCSTEGTPRGASWGPRDAVIFATSAPGTGLMEVSVSGGNPRALTRPDTAKGEVGHFFPEILPGGEAVLFTIVTRRPIENSQVAVLDLRTGHSRVLVQGGSNAHYAGSGHLVYALRGAVYAVAFDLEHLQVRSDPILVEERLVTKSLSGAASFSLTRDGALVYLAGDAVSVARALVWVDRHGGETRILAPPRAYFDARVSPDGRRMALGVRDAAVGVWLGAFDGTLTPLSSDPSSSELPVWTPDSLRVVYSSGTPSTLFWRAANGTGPAERLLDSPTEMIANSFSRDGTRLVVEQTHPTTGSDLYLLSLTDRSGGGSRFDARPLVATRFNERNGEISPDGAWLAYQSDMSGKDEIYVQPFPNLEQGPLQISTGGGSVPAWARTGGELFYFAPDGKLMAVPVEHGHAFWHGNAVVAVDRRYFRSINQDRNYDVSSDGRFLMIKDQAASTSAAPQLVVVQNFFEELKRLVPAK